MVVSSALVTGSKQCTALPDQQALPTEAGSAKSDDSAGIHRWQFTAADDPGNSSMSNPLKEEVSNK